MRLCWSHIPHCWKSHALALFSKRSSEGAHLKRLERKMEKNDRESLVFITVSRSEGSGEPVHLLLAHVIQECEG